MKSLTPMKAIRARCLDCSGGSAKEVRECPIDWCALFEYRFGHRPAEKTRTPLKAIRARCLDCCEGNPLEPRLCTAEKCPLYPYRLGKMPKGYNSPSEDKKAKTMPLRGEFLANKAITGGDVE